MVNINILAAIAKSSYFEIGCILLILLLCVFFFVQITFNGKLNKKVSVLESLAYVDKITGGYNDTKFRMKASELLKFSDDQFAVGYININNFRYINDFYGVECGNTVLKDAFDKLVDMVGSDGLCARVISDRFEFIIKYGEREILLQSLNDYVSNIYANIGAEDRIKLKCSCGVYFVENNKEKISSHIDKAEIALKQIKESNYGTVEVYDENYGKVLAKNQKYTILMEDALKHNEFKVYIQPKIELASGKCVGGEALVRWISKEMGFISPGDFIPLFEKNGFVAEVDMYVLGEVCKLIEKRVQAQKKAVTISVNQSRLHLNNPNYIEEIEGILSTYDIPLEYLEFELTENTFLDITTEIVHILDKLRELGISISIDDFGNGYSSLNLLKDLNFDVLKLDQEFLKSTKNSERSAYIIKAIIDMAHALDLKVVCEGVETQEQVDFLRAVECDMAQGYYYAKPMPIEDFEKFIEEH